MTDQYSLNDVFNNLDKKLVVNWFCEIVTKYYVVHAQQENVQKLAELTSSTKD